MKRENNYPPSTTSKVALENENESISPDSRNILSTVNLFHYIHSEWIVCFSELDRSCKLLSEENQRNSTYTYKFIYASHIPGRIYTKLVSLIISSKGNWMNGGKWCEVVLFLPFTCFFLLNCVLYTCINIQK